NTVTSSSIIGFRYKDGLIVASDTSLNYGSLKLDLSVEKHHILSNNTLIIVKGEYSDFQKLKRICNDEMEEDPQMGVKEWIRFIQRIMYYRRSNIQPLNLSIIVAGIDKNFKNENTQINSIEKFTSPLVIGVIDQIGNFYTDDTLAAGMAAYISIPFTRAQNLNEMTKEQAIKLMRENLQSLYYRDCMADNNVKILGVDENGIWETNEFKILGNWEFGRNLE
ncbi:20S proteasome, regulatory subunit beta type PSMB4/PRE4, partial [Pseudoloma neurophilia]